MLTPRVSTVFRNLEAPFVPLSIDARSPPFMVFLGFRIFAFSLSISKPESGSDSVTGTLRNGALAMRWARPEVDNDFSYAFACRRGWRGGRRGGGLCASAIAGERDNEGAIAETLQERAIGAGGANISYLDVHTNED